ncbi:hypothetical protein OPQ81_001175 [Rhizoctonia solani]|nr:hypothetical protein OPQ81_001175 [Rhizoctonia solani]
MFTGVLETLRGPSPTVKAITIPSSPSSSFSLRHINLPSPLRKTKASQKSDLGASSFQASLPATESPRVTQSREPVENSGSGYCVPNKASPMRSHHGSARVIAVPLPYFPLHPEAPSPHSSTGASKITQRSRSSHSKGYKMIGALPQPIPSGTVGKQMKVPMPNTGSSTSLSNAFIPQEEDRTNHILLPNQMVGYEHIVT